MSQGPLPTPPPAAPPRAGMPIIAIVAIVLVIVVFVLGVLAAIAIPSFVNYMRRAKAAEAETNLGALGLSVVSYHDDQGALPAPLPPTPAPASDCQRHLWPPDAAPGWNQLMFHPADPLYYSYSIEPMAGANGVWVRAVGDLDCDGIFSRFERSVIVGPHGGADLGPLIRTDETE